MPTKTSEPYLRKVLDLIGMKQAYLAEQLGTHRQQVSKWASEGRPISPTWAKRMEPIIGVDWTYLVHAEFPPDLEQGNDQGKLINKQLLLLKDAWPLLNLDERAAILSTVLSLAASRRKSV